MAFFNNRITIIIMSQTVVSEMVYNDNDNKWPLAVKNVKMNNIFWKNYDY